MDKAFVEIKNNHITEETLPHFDDYAQNYEKLHAESIKFSGFSPDYFDEHKIRTLSRILKDNKSVKSTFNFLNFGCGIGKSEKFIRQYFPEANISSADISEESLQIAQKRNIDVSGVEYFHFNTVEELNFVGKFDIIFMANVLHHIPDDLQITTLEYLRKFLKPNGFLYIFEHNPINPVTRRAFNTCEFDQGCHMIFPWEIKAMLKSSGYSNIKLNYILFFPKILNGLNPYEKYLKSLPIGAQYYIKTR